MNTEIKISGNSVIVVDENKNEKELVLTNNLEEILTLENDLEYIKDELDKIDFESKHTTSNNKLIKLINAFGIGVIIATCLTLGMTNTAALWIMPLLLATTIGFSSYIVNTNTKYKNTLKLQESILKETFNKEAKKIMELKRNSKKVNIQEDKSKKISTSTYLKDLKRKLELIEEYQTMKKGLKKDSEYFFTSPKLKSLGYSESDIEFIQMLMEQDIKFENEKQKTLIKK